MSEARLRSGLVWLAMRELRTRGPCSNPPLNTAVALQFSCAAPQTWGSRNASVASVAGTVMAGESSAKRNADRERVQRVETRKAEVAAQRERMPSQSRQVNPRGRDRGELWTRWISKPGKERPR
eukprot:484813-Rhodomonas_salina.1